MELLSKAVTVAMLSFVVSSMLAMGLGLTVAQIIAPLRNVRLVVLSLLAKFCIDTAGRSCACQDAAARRTAGRRPAFVGRCCRRALPAETGSDRQGQLGIRGWFDGVVDGGHGRLSATRVAGVAAGSFGQPGEDRPLTFSADAAAAGRRVGSQRPVPHCRRVRKASPQSGLLCVFRFDAAPVLDSDAFRSRQIKS